MNVRLLLSILVMLSGVSAAKTVAALCLEAQEYRVSIGGSTVSILPRNFQKRRCGDPDGLLRQNVATGAVAKLPGQVTGTTEGYCGGDGYLDQCVPPGKYRYGLAKPYDCCPTCCTTQYYIDVEITTPLAPDCEANRFAGNRAPVPFTGQVPWSGSQEICAYVAPPDAAAPPPRIRDAGSPSSTGQADASAGNTPAANPTSSGCSVGGSPESPAVLGMSALLLAFGLVRAGTRKRNRRPAEERNSR
jgi:hypothetical protein